MSLHEGIAKLHERLLKLVAHVEPMVTRAVASLSSPDRDLLPALVAEDHVIDQREVEIEDLCLHLIALQHPVAEDLRRVMACLKITGQLERIADHAVNIAERADSLIGRPAIRRPPGIGEMASLAIGMLKDAIQAYLDGDTGLAAEVARRDDRVDNLNREMIDILQDELRRDSNLVEPAFLLIRATLHIERIADLATNIADDVIFMVTGRIVRHEDDPGAI